MINLDFTTTLYNEFRFHCAFGTDNKTSAQTMPVRILLGMWWMEKCACTQHTANESYSVYGWCSDDKQEAISCNNYDRSQDKHSEASPSR